MVKALTYDIPDYKIKLKPDNSKQWNGKLNSSAILNRNMLYKKPLNSNCGWKREDTLANTYISTITEHRWNTNMADSMVVI